MKFKSLIIAGALAVTAPLFGQTVVSGSNEFGILKVTTTTKNTIVSVPWVECGTTTEEAVKVANLVMTTNLGEGDSLYVYQSGKWYNFKLNADKTGWTDATTSTMDEGTHTVTENDVALSCGTALILSRANAGSSLDFYLYGQVPTSIPTMTVAGGGSYANPVFTLLANPTANDLSMVALNSFGNVRDEIRIPDDNGGSDVYTKAASTWKKRNSNGTFSDVTDADKIPAGKGFWYINKGTGSVTITWPKAQ